eukprot:9868396-Karenia_brevis.AAC.1
MQGPYAQYIGQGLRSKHWRPSNSLHSVEVILTKKYTENLPSSAKWNLIHVLWIQWQRVQYIEGARGISKGVRPIHCINSKFNLKPKYTDNDNVQP